MLNILHHHLNWIEALADLDQEAANAVFYNGLGGKDDNGKTERLGGGMGLSLPKVMSFLVGPWLMQFEWRDFILEFWKQQQIRSQLMTSRVNLISLLFIGWLRWGCRRAAPMIVIGGLVMFLLIGMHPTTVGLTIKSDQMNAINQAFCCSKDRPIW